MLARQAYLCLICVKPLTLSTAVIDHDHALAALHPHRVERGCPACVRGLICMACNTGLGAFRDDPTAMRRAANYIEEARR